MIYLLPILIVFAYAVDALQDGINFTKAGQGMDLNHLWHAAKYVHVGAVLAVGALNVLVYFDIGWLVLLCDLIGFVIGVLVWTSTYPLWRKVDWPDWA